MIWITSDFHLFHKKEFLYIPRGFSTIEEMNYQIIDNYNHVINQEDDIYILGDLLLGGADNLENGLQLLNQLKGKIHLIRGNHDSDILWMAYKNLSNVVEMENSLYLNYNHFHFYLSHFPTLTSNRDYDKPLKARILNLCGHTHTNNKWADIDKGYIYHCELDAHNNFPILLDHIIEDFKNYSPLQLGNCE